MHTIADSIYRDASIGIAVALPKAGTALENGFVFDSSAREIKAMADLGLVRIISESRATENERAPITDMVFVRMR